MDWMRIGRTALPDLWTIEARIYRGNDIPIWVIIETIKGSYENALEKFYYINFMEGVSRKIRRVKKYFKVQLKTEPTETLNKIGDLFDIYRNTNESDVEYRERLQREVWSPK